MAYGSYLTTWQSRYPSSLTDDNVVNGTGKNCQLCHASSSGGDNFNGYGWRLQQNIGSGLAAAIAAAESHDSDLDVAGGFTNLAEINADTQPGWTTGANNTVYSSSASPSTGQPFPSNIRGNMDPVIATVPDISLNPASSSFGTVFIGAPGNLGVTVENLGNADLQVTVVNLCAGTSSEFSWSPAAPFSVPAGGGVTLTVTYTPGDTGTDVGCLQIASNDPDENPIALAVDGSGQQQTTPTPDINLNPSSLNFNTVFLGDSSSLSARIENLGTADLNVSMIDRCAGTGSEFTWSPTAAFVVPAGGNHSLVVIYTPLDEGVDLGCLEIVSDDPDENPVLSQVTATGAQRPPVVVDYDISRFQTRTRVALSRVRAVQPTLLVNNPRGFIEPRSATVVGMQNGVEIYNETVEVASSAGLTRFPVVFPRYTPVALGRITWTVTIADDDPDIDQAIAVTKVVK
jgi:hypothetical protein